MVFQETEHKPFSHLFSPGFQPMIAPSYTCLQVLGSFPHPCKLL